MKTSATIYSLFITMLVFTMLLFSCDTENSLEPPFRSYFVKYYGGDGDQTAIDLLVNDDGTILLLGNWSLDLNADNRIYLIKTDPEGNILWEKKLGTSSDRAKDIERTNDNNFIILADHSTTDINIDIKLIRIDGEGTVVDSVVYGSPGNENSKTVTPLDDGGYIVTGSTEYDTARILDPSRPEDQSDIFHFRCNSNLVFDSFFWKGQYGPGTFDIGTRVIQYSPDLFYVFGSTNLVHPDNPNGNLNLVYYSINSGGTNSSPNYLGDFDNDTQSSYAMQVPVQLGGGYLVVGTESTPSGSVNLHVVKLRSPLLFDPANDEQFDYEIAVEARNLTSLSATAVVMGTRGYVLLANEARETGNNIWLTKIDQNGNQLWSASYGSEEDDDQGAAVVELKDGRLLVIGSVRLINNQYKIVLMKLNQTGQLSD
jgi:hypothetical protein